MSPLFITRFQHESTVFTSLEITFLCETLAQFKKLSLTFSSALKSQFPDGLSRLKSNNLCEAEVDHKLPSAKRHRSCLHLSFLCRELSAALPVSGQQLPLHLYPPSEPGSLLHRSDKHCCEGQSQPNPITSGCPLTGP